VIESSVVAALRKAASELREYAAQHDGTMVRQHARALADTNEAEARIIEREFSFAMEHMK
jgi:hypothetical protein